MCKSNHFFCNSAHFYIIYDFCSINILLLQEWGKLKKLKKLKELKTIVFPHLTKEFPMLGHTSLTSLTSLTSKYKEKSPKTLLSSGTLV